MTPQNKDGLYMSGQIGRMGTVDVSSADFSLPKTGNQPTSFLLKNENEDAITVSVVMAFDGENGTPVTTTVYPGWNPEMVIAVKQQSGVSNLKWGI